MTDLMDVTKRRIESGENFFIKPLELQIQNAQKNQEGMSVINSESIEKIILLQKLMCSYILTMDNIKSHTIDFEITDLSEQKKETFTDGKKHALQAVAVALNVVAACFAVGSIKFTDLKNFYEGSQALAKAFEVGGQINDSPIQVAQTDIDHSSKQSQDIKGALNQSESRVKSMDDELSKRIAEMHNAKSQILVALARQM